MTRDDLDELYRKILQDLKGENRPQLKLPNQDIRDLNQLFGQFLALREEEGLRKVLCVLNNGQSSGSYLAFTDGLIQLLEEGSFRKKDELLIFTLAALGKQIIPLYQRNGDRLPFRLMESLKSLLHDSRPEVLLWNLRIIDSLGVQALVLREDVKKLSLGIFYFTNPLLRDCKKIIAELLKKWSHFS